MQNAVAELFARSNSGEIPAEFAVIVPTSNERDNVTELVSRLDQCLQGKAWKVILSTTIRRTEPPRAFGRSRVKTPRVLCVQRIGRRGLSTACVEGILASSSPYLAVIDGDCQHDEAVLPRMLELLSSVEADVVVGSAIPSAVGSGPGTRLGQR